jgi:hypothetical protein
MLQTIRLKTTVLRRSLLSVDHSSQHDVWLRRERDSADCNNHHNFLSIDPLLR